MRISAPDIFDTSPALPQNIPDAKQLDKERAKQVAQEFETLYLDMMLKSMRSTVPSEDMGHAEQMYREMLDGEYSKEMSKSQDFGIQKMVYDWITQSAGEEPPLSSKETLK
jgi:flagellar protein FlgJ